MRKYLTKKERTTILKELTKEQKKTLFKIVGKRYRSYFADVLAKYKGTRDWSFYCYIDHGRVRKDIRCAFLLLNKILNNLWQRDVGIWMYMTLFNSRDSRY